MPEKPPPTPAIPPQPYPVLQKPERSPNFAGNITTCAVNRAVKPAKIIVTAAEIALADDFSTAGPIYMDSCPVMAAGTWRRAGPGN
jgi:hypothetical protein